MYTLPRPLLPVEVPRPLKVATSETPMGKIWKLRESEFGRLYPGVTRFNDIYDEYACILYSENDEGDITSTGRLVLDGEVGLPADEIIKPEVDRLRSQGLRIAEPSKFAISRQAQGLLPLYLRTYYGFAARCGINSLIFIIRDKNVSFYEKAFDARVLKADVGYTYGTQYRFSLLECEIKKNNPAFMQA